MSSTSSHRSAELIACLAEKYMWWPAVGGRGHGEDRILALVMNIGSYEDILRLEATLGRQRLAQVMRHAAPGWISARSWDFWRGRLRAQAGLEVPERAPRRTFYAAASKTHAVRMQRRHCEERERRSNPGAKHAIYEAVTPGLLRFARNDGARSARP